MHGCMQKKGKGIFIESRFGLTLTTQQTLNKDLELTSSYKLQFYSACSHDVKPLSTFN